MAKMRLGKGRKRSTSQPVKSTLGLEAKRIGHGIRMAKVLIKGSSLSFVPLRRLTRRGSSSLSRSLIDAGAHSNVSARPGSECGGCQSASNLGCMRDRYDGAAGLFGHQYRKPEGTRSELHTLSAPASSEGCYESPSHPLGEAAMCKGIRVSVGEQLVRKVDRKCRTSSDDFAMR
jgi:hypothetical protein